MTSAPIFVVGLARSGTNLLARMLGAHSAVSMALDPLMPVFKSLRQAIVARQAPAVAARFHPASPFHDYYFSPDGPLLLDAMLHGTVDIPLPAGERSALRLRTRDRAALESPALGERLAAIDGRTYGELLAGACAIVRGAKPGATRAAIKEVWVFEFIPLLARAFPQARFLVIDRDPRAIIASLVSMAGRDPGQAAHVPSYLRHWRKSIALIRRFEASADLRGRFSSVRYEAIVAEPETEGRRIAAAVGLDFEPGMLALSADGWTGNSSYGEGRDIYGGSAQRWRSALSPATVATADFLCGPEMALTPYELSPAALTRGDVFDYLDAAGRVAGSWRSDSGDAIVDIGGELLRHALLAASAPDESLVRRCFLFTDIFEAIRHARTPALAATTGPTV